jgi:peptide/nickel transport system permease protein
MSRDATKTRRRAADAQRVFASFLQKRIGFRSERKKQKTFARWHWGPNAGLPLVLAIFCFLGPLVWPPAPDAVDADMALAAPSWAHPAGTDDLGRDQLARLMAGGAETLSVAVPAAMLAVLLGVSYGVVAAFGPALLGRALLRLLDALLALPSLVILLCGASVLPLGRATVCGLIAVTAWFSLARLVRAEIVALRDRDFTHAARQLGAGPLHVAYVHYLPHIGRLLAVNGALILGDAILSLSSLSFLGFGLPPPAASWGGMLQSGLALIDLHAWWLVLPPGALIAASLYAAFAIGEAIAEGRDST